MLFSPVSASQAGPKSSTPLPNYDIVLFIGMAAGRSYYSMETQAHRDGYKLPDVDGMTIIGDDYWTRLGAPEIIRTGFDVDLLFGRWRQNVPDEIDVQTSDDAGRYLCDYIYYTGLCEYWLHSGKDMTNDRPVLFLHVPGEADDETIKRGVLVAEGLIKAMAVTWAGRTGVEKIK